MFYVVKLSFGLIPPCPRGSCMPPKALRLGRRGKLKYTDLHIRKPLLPALDPSTAHEECRISTRNLHCFAAGDFRSILAG